MKIHNIGGRSFVYSEIKRSLIRNAFIISDDSQSDVQNKIVKAINLEAESKEWIIPKADFYFIWSSQADPAACELRPKETRFVNVDKTKELIDVISTMGGRIIYPSSNLVFSGEEPFVSSETPTAPRNEYARQKVEVENHLMDKYSDRGHYIFRMPKIWSWRAKFYQRWERERKEGIPIRVSTNRMVSPIIPSTIVDFLNHAIHNLNPHESKILNLGNSFEVSYSEMAKSIYKIRNINNVVFEEFIDYTSSPSGLIHNSLLSSFELGQQSEQEFWSVVARTLDEQS